MSGYDFKLFTPHTELMPKKSSVPAQKSRVARPVVLFSYDTMLQEIKDELTQEELDKLYDRGNLFKLFDRADKEDIAGNRISRSSADLILNQNEQKIFLAKLKEKHPRLFKIVNKFIKSLQSKSDAEKIADIFNLKENDSSLIGNDQIFVYGLSLLNNENLISVEREYDGLSLLYDIFEDINERAKYNDKAKNEDYYNETTGEYYYEYKDRNPELVEKAQKDLKIFEEKCIGFANYLLITAKKKNIYTKDYEKDIANAINIKDIKSLAIATQRLADRIIITTDKNKAFNASKNALKPKEANGQIDADFVQGFTGDCWFLSSLKSMCSDEEFLKRINDMITVNKEGDIIKSVTVKIQEKDYTIDYENIKCANEYATGDMDIRAIEMAMNQYMRENDLGYGDISLGWEEQDAYKFLFGEDNVEVTEYCNDENPDELDSEKYLKVLKENSDGKIISSLGINHYDINLDQEEQLFAEDKNGKPEEIQYGHSYNYTRIDEKYLYFTDPNNPKKELRVLHEKVGKIFDTACTVKLRVNKE